jgi:hypothetical protein
VDNRTRKAALDNSTGLSECITELLAALRAAGEKIAQLENDLAFQGPVHLKGECDRLLQVNRSILSQISTVRSHKHPYHSVMKLWSVAFNPTLLPPLLLRHVRYLLICCYNHVYNCQATMKPLLPATVYKAQLHREMKSLIKVGEN